MTNWPNNSIICKKVVFVVGYVVVGGRGKSKGPCKRTNTTRLVSHLRTRARGGNYILIVFLLGYMGWEKYRFLQMPKWVWGFTYSRILMSFLWIVVMEKLLFIYVLNRTSLSLEPMMSGGNQHQQLTTPHNSRPLVHFPSARCPAVHLHHLSPAGDLFVERFIQ